MPADPTLREPPPKCARCLQRLLEPSQYVPGYGAVCALCVVDLRTLKVIHG